MPKLVRTEVGNPPIGVHAFSGSYQPYDNKNPTYKQECRSCMGQFCDIYPPQSLVCQLTMANLIDAIALPYEVYWCSAYTGFTDEEKMKICRLQHEFLSRA